MKVSEELRLLQSEIDALQEEHHKQMQDLIGERDVKRNDLIATRTEVLRAKGPKDFWSTVIRTHPDVSSELLGSYDDMIFDSLSSFNVTYFSDGYRVEMKFNDNDYFSDKLLWAEFHGEHNVKFSGVHWKAGKGPLSEDEGDDGGGERQHRKVGEKSQREERGNSFFSSFEEMPPHPDEDEQFAELEEDDEELEQAVEEWEEEFTDRMDVLDCLVNEIWANPADVLLNAVGSEAAEPADAKDVAA